MSKLKLNKRTLAWVLAILMTASGTGLVLKSCSDGKKHPVRIENAIGHSNINPFINFGVKEEDFVVLNMGDHDSVRTRFEDKKARFCNEHNITLGVIISTDSQDESSIYDDVEYAKGLVRKYDIDFPVYLDINHIMTNDDLNNEMKTKLIKDFVEKCSANNIYVGLYGTDTNLSRVRKYCGITEYDAYLVMDKEEITYEGTYNVYEDLDGNIKASFNIAEAITAKKLNESERFANDGMYEISYGEDITDVALKYGLSVNELLAFNGITRRDIETGTKIRIPSVVEKVVSKDSTTTYKELSTPIRGCDISYAQGDNIDWEQIAENFEFIILKANQGLSADSHFERNALNASQNSIPIGVYCYNQYHLNNCDDMSEFKKKQIAQADKTLELLKNKKIEYPVYLDIEGNIESNQDTASLLIMLEIWKTKMESAGYEPGIYCNQSAFRYMQSKVNYDLADKFQIWIAGGEQYTGGKYDIPLEDVRPSASVKDNIPAASIVQTTDSAVGTGAGDGRGHLDINFSYYDYTEKTVTGTPGVAMQEKEFTRTDDVLVGTAVGAGCVLAAGLGIFGVVKSKKKTGTKGKQKVKTV